MVYPINHLSLRTKTTKLNVFNMKLLFIMLAGLIIGILLNVSGYEEPGNCLLGLTALLYLITVIRKWLQL